MPRRCASYHDGKSRTLDGYIQARIPERAEAAWGAVRRRRESRSWPPVLVGGAAVEFYTGGALVSGDFDVVTGAQVELEQALLRRGFERPTGPGQMLRGLRQPALGIGVEVVSGALFDGASDRSRVRVVSTGAGEIAIPPVEDMIADRLGQYCTNPSGHAEMLEHAIVLYEIAVGSLEPGLDRVDPNSRILQETAGTHDLRFLIERSHGTDNPRASG